VNRFFRRCLRWMIIKIYGEEKLAMLAEKMSQLRHNPKLLARLKKTLIIFQLLSTAWFVTLAILILIASTISPYLSIVVFVGGLLLGYLVTVPVVKRLVPRQ